MDKCITEEVEVVREIVNGFYGDTPVSYMGVPIEEFSKEELIKIIGLMHENHIAEQKFRF